MELTDEIVICIVASIIILPLILIRLVWEVKFLVREIRKPKRKTIKELIDEL